MRWVTRPGVHIDRASSAWLIRRFIDQEAEFDFAIDIGRAGADSIAFDMRGADLSHHGADCTFETLLRRYDLLDPALWRLARIVHEADLEDGRFDAPEAAGLDVLLRALGRTRSDTELLALTSVLFDSLYEAFRAALLTDGRTP